MPRQDIGSATSFLTEQSRRVALHQPSLCPVNSLADSLSPHVLLRELESPTWQLILEADVATKNALQPPKPAEMAMQFPVLVVPAAEATARICRGETPSAVMAPGLGTP